MVFSLLLLSKNNKNICKILQKTSAPFRFSSVWLLSSTAQGSIDLRCFAQFVVEKIPQAKGPLKQPTIFEKKSPISKPRPAFK